MNILVTGSSGTLASEFNFYKKEDFDVIGIDIKPSILTKYLYDLSDVNRVKKIIEEVKPDIVFHFAAQTNVDYCESNKEEALRNNFIATKNIVNALEVENTPLLFLSSISIFDGNSKLPYTEKSEPNPSNFYAETKFLAEEYIQQRVERYIIMRIGWLVGNPKLDKKFFGNILNQINNKQGIMIGENTQFGSLSFAKYIVATLFQLCSSKLWGIYHYASKGYCTRYDIIRYILQYYNIESQFILKEGNLNSFGLLAKRPPREILSVEKIESLGFEINCWQLDLATYLEDYSDLFLR